MNTDRTIKIKQLASEQTVTREAVIMGACTFTNHHDSRDAHIAFWNAPAADRAEEDDESVTDICVPAGATVAITNFFMDCPGERLAHFP